MNKERLEQMVTMLRALPPEKREEFSLSHWNCGTTACAIGHACMDPVFTKQGLARTPWGAPIFDGCTSWWAVDKFFDINGKEATYLFSEDSYPDPAQTTPGQVAQRVAEFIESGEGCSSEKDPSCTSS